MTPIPVVCTACHQLWMADNIFGVGGSGSVRVTISNTTVSPCPYCGGVGRIPDGVYELTEHVTRLLGAIPIDELRRVREILLDAQQRGANVSEVEAEIERQVPAAASVVHLLKEHQQSLAVWLALLLAMIQTLIAMGLVPTTRREEVPTMTPQQVEEVITRVGEQLRADARPQTPPRTREAKVGRNDPCPCGSGKKYKHCHGR